MTVWQQDWISKWALYSPDKIVLEEHESGKTITYKKLNELANGVVYYLKTQFNVKKGDRVAVLSEYSIDYVVLFSAAQKAGFTIIPMNYRLTQSETRKIMENCKPSLIFFDSKFQHLIDEKYMKMALKLDELSHVEPHDKDFVQIVDENDPIFIIYTSGTTGQPKGVLYTHKMAFWNSINTSISLLVNTESRSINVMPSFHTGGWNVLLLPFLHHGGYMYLCKKFEPSIVLERLAQLRCTMFMGVPTMLAMMAQESYFETCDLRPLNYIIVGGEAMPISLIEKYSTKSVAIRQGYGMTEVGPNLTSLHQNDAIRKKGSIGRPNFYVNHRIVNAAGQDCLSNESGELWLQGPMVTPGYFNNDEETKRVFSDDGLWFRTGDVVLEDEEKYLFIVDRIKNMYISGGENVYPSEVEKIIREYTDIMDCAIIGIPDKKWGEVGYAFVVANALIDEAEILNYCQSQLAKYKIPKYFKFIEALPKTDSGKIDRKQLKQIALSLF